MHHNRILSVPIISQMVISKLEYTWLYKIKTVIYLLITNNPQAIRAASIQLLHNMSCHSVTLALLPHSYRSNTTHFLRNHITRKPVQLPETGKRQVPRAK